MLRKFVSAAIIVVLVGGFTLAAEVQGTLKKITVDGEKVKSITVTTKDKDDKEVDQEIKCTDTTEFVGGRKGATAMKSEAVVAMAAKIGTEVGKGEVKTKFHPKVTVTVDDESKAATKVQIQRGRRKKADTE